MKEAIITGIDGYFKNVTLVADHMTGIFPIMQPVKEPDELEPMEAQEEPTEPETVLVGYTVAAPVPEGLYKPKYDLEAWKAAEAQYERDLEAWKQEQQQRDGEDEAEPSPPLEPVDLSQFWVEGLSKEEIDEIKNRPQEPTVTEILGEQLFETQNELIQTKKENGMLGRTLFDLQTELMLKGVL
ncbi:Uncharacterised protein [Chlamydia abortus]|nr:Uncharacterised protein [Chlamydia abortus]